MAFFAIMNPIANTAIFAALTNENNAIEKKAIAFKALVLAFILITLFAILGKSIFHLFGISLPALRVTGGILVFVIGYHMLHGSNSSLHSGQNDQETDIAISPMAVPLLAGPGTIATAMNYAASAGWIAILITITAFACLCLITFFCFIYSKSIINAIGKSGLSIVTRLMGLILAVIGVQMLITGIKSALNI